MDLHFCMQPCKGIPRTLYTRCLRKTVQNCLCQNFVKFPSILIIFGRLMAKWLNFYATYTLFTSPHSCYHTTLLNTKVPNFTVSQENCEQIMSELFPISINLITFSRYMTN